MKQWANWLRAMQDQHDFMSYRQDLPGYGEPAEGHWDGYQRINSDSCSGGVVGVFRQNAKASQRWVTVGFLNPAAHYEVCHAPGGERVIASTGQQLADEGFLVELKKPYDGAVFEIRRVP